MTSAPPQSRPTLSVFRSLLLGFAALLLQACSAESPPPQSTTTTPAPNATATTAPAPTLAPISVSGSYWIELSPVLAAAHQFYPVEMEVLEGGITNITAGVADLATNAETQLLRESVRNPDLRIIMTVTESFYRLVARRSAGIESLEDLRGKRVMTPAGTSAGYYLEAMLQSVGMSDQDVELVPFPRAASARLGMDLMAEAIANAEVDAISIWEPTPHDAIQMLGDDAIVLQDRSVYREVFNLHARATDLADPAKRQAIVAFVRAVAQATEALQQNVEPFLPLIRQYSTFSDEQIIAAIPEMEFPIQIIPDMLDVLETEEQWVARNANREPRSREELARFIDYSVLEEALAD